MQLHGELGDVGETEIGHPAEGSRRTAASFPQPDSGGVIFGQLIQGARMAAARATRNGPAANPLQSPRVPR